jgi:quercetin dioxygenase-like cupin family protein
MRPQVVRSAVLSSLLLFLNTLVSLSQPIPDTSHLTLKACVNVLDTTRAERTAVGYQYWFVGKDFLDGRTLKMSVVAPHAATHPPHRHLEDEIFFVLEGAAELFLNGETTVAHPYTSFYCPSNSLHGIRNLGDATLKYLVIKKYPKP